MQKKLKNIIIVIEFFAILFGVFILNVTKESEIISTSERRKLAQFPKLTTTRILNGTVSKEFENYATDQFIKRDNFRQIKYWFSTNILKQKDTNKMFVYNDSIYKMEYPLNEMAIEKSAKKINKVYDKYLNDMNVYYAIIPDKNYYLNDDHLKIDYSKLEEIMKSNLLNFEYIDIKDTLDFEAFYKTDIHWKQESILDVANNIKQAMSVENVKTSYDEIELGQFFGVYYGQVGINVNSDRLKILNNDIIENATTYNYETEKSGKVYDLEKYNSSKDKYDIFVSGATPLIEIENKNVSTTKELLMFRDSFGSSLAPLMLDSYRKITLIDLRYINSDLLSRYINFDDQDVLFIYSLAVLNQNILK